jgi:hypothetical protein
MTYVIVRIIKIQFPVVVSLLLFAACSSVQEDGQSIQGNNDMQDASVQISTMVQKMNAEKNPQNHINSIRRYALDNFNNLTKEEFELIRSSNPRIYNDDTTLEYCFVWAKPDNGGCLEVVATPPPECTPIAVFRRDRVYFP